MIVQILSLLGVVGLFIVFAQAVGADVKYKNIVLTWFAPVFFVAIIVRVAAILGFITSTTALSTNGFMGTFFMLIMLTEKVLSRRNPK